MQSQLYRPDLCPNVVGFPSHGVYCWLNSVLQSILGLSSIIDILKTRKLIFQGNKVAAALIDLIEQPNSANHTKFIEAFTASPSFVQKLKQGQQNCAADGFTEIIECLRSKDIKLLCSNSYASTLDCSVCEHNVPIRRENNLEIHMVTPIVFSNRGDFCDWIHVHESHVVDYACGKCGRSDSMSRVDVLKAIREIVVICFDGPLSHQYKWFPETLRFPGVAPNSILNYQLVAKIERSGVNPTAENGFNAASGHYWAHVLRMGKSGPEWLLANDMQISQGNPTPTAETFIVMYHLARP